MRVSAATVICDRISAPLFAVCLAFTLSLLFSGQARAADDVLVAGTVGLEVGDAPAARVDVPLVPGSMVVRTFLVDNTASSDANLRLDVAGVTGADVPGVTATLYDAACESVVFEGPASALDAVTLGCAVEAGERKELTLALFVPEGDVSPRGLSVGFEGVA